jgi:Ca2+:H+ antiporter
VKSAALLGVLGPLAMVAVAVGSPTPWVFVLTAAALIPAAKILGDATEDVAVHAGARAGGLLNGTLGGATALVLATLAVRAGLFELAKASIVGAIVGNLLLVLGLGLLLGGLRHGTQYFDRAAGGLSGTMMILAVIALAVPALYGQWVPLRNRGPVESLSEAVAGVMMVVWALSLYYSLVWNVDEQAIAGIHRDTAHWTRRRAVITLVGALGAVVVLGAVLVAAASRAIAQLGWSELFLGVVVLPFVGSVAQHLGAVESAWHDRVDLTTTITSGASLQIILLVTPLLVFASLIMGTPMDLIFGQLELAALAAAALVAALVSIDGESHWLEGAMLLAVYALLALAVFWWPAGAGAP